jgi:aldose 1-epimerase
MARAAAVVGLGIVGWACTLSTAAAQSRELTTKNSSENTGHGMTIERAKFGQTADGTQVHRFTISNSKGMRLVLSDYGAHVIAVEVPDREGKLANVTLGFDGLDGYQQRHPFFGSTVGRFCNRIARGQFSLGGKSYQLATNNGPNHLHGGESGFDRKAWEAQTFESGDEAGVRFTRTSPDGEEGYPGNLKVVAVYSLNDNNEVKMHFEATTDAPTIVNLTNHCYWNLGGAGSGQVLNHQLMIAADHYLSVDDTLIPTGDRTPVEGTPMDFTEPMAIGSRIAQVGSDPTGYDHCYGLRGHAGQLRLAARVTEPKSGRVMEIHTTQPGIQFYTGNFLDGSAGNGGFGKHDAFCLETQHFPDSPNHPEFPTTELKPGETFQATTIHRFTTE